MLRFTHFLHSTFLVCLLGFISFVASSQTVTKTYTAPSSVSVDGCGSYCTNLPGVTFVSSDFPAGCEISDVNVNIVWAKTDGSCTSPGTGNSFHSETNFRIDGPQGINEILVAPGTYTGTGTISAVSTTFDQAAATVVGGANPFSGTFQPNTGNLNNYNGTDAIGTWTLRAGDTGAGDPLCVSSYSVTITMVAGVDDPAFSYGATSFCSTDSTALPTITGDPGGIFTSTAGLVINGPTGEIDLIASTPGTYDVTYTTPAPCSSSLTETITLLASSFGTDVQTACDTYTWINGTTYTSSNNSATHTLTNAIGCDSIVTLDLTITNSTIGTDSLVVCDSYTAPSGAIFDSTGVYMDTIPNASGCDSVITIDLTVNNSYAWSITEFSCGPYTSANGMTYSTSGVYTEVMSTVNGCDSTLTIDLTVEDLDTSVTLSGATLTSNWAGATSYQWIDCSTNMPIIGQTSQIYAPTANGSYAVVVSSGSCTDTSSCYNVNSVGIEEFDLAKEMRIYPNPTNDGNFRIAFSGDINAIKVIDVAGRELLVDVDLESATVSGESLTEGHYFVYVTTGKGIAILDLVVQK